MSFKVTRDDKKLTFEWELESERYENFEKAMKKWNFKDEKSFFRFAISLLAFNEYDFFLIKKDGFLQDVVPACELKKKDIDKG